MARRAGISAVPRGVSRVRHGEARAEAHGRAAPAAAGDDGAMAGGRRRARVRGAVCRAHAIAHALAAGERERSAWACAGISGLLEALCREDGPAALEDGAAPGREELGDGELGLLDRAVRAESHWLREAPEAPAGAGLQPAALGRMGGGANRADAAVPARLTEDPAATSGTDVDRRGAHAVRPLRCGQGLRVSPDGQRIVSGLRDRNLGLGRGDRAAPLPPSKNRQVLACAISPDGQRIVSASRPPPPPPPTRRSRYGTSRPGQLLSTLRRPLQFRSMPARSAPMASHRLGLQATVRSRYGTLRPGSSSPPSKTTPVGSMPARSALMACASSRPPSDNTLKVWDLATGQLLSTLEGHVHSVNAMRDQPRWAGASSPASLGRHAQGMGPCDRAAPLHPRRPLR